MAKLLSAALIVRDEEQVLGDCLRSVRELVDEIVVVDTGSRDRTREIAASHGAHVTRFEWRDDFAAARNHAIEQATGDWILYIDADERIRPYDRCALEEILSDIGLVACKVRFHPRTGFTAYPELRLFRRDGRIRFAGAMHETIVPAVQAVAAADGTSVGFCDLTIDHIGYDGDQSHKLQRNLRLLEIAIRNDPARVYLWWHLGTVYRDLGRLPDAEAAWWEGVRRARSRQSHMADDGLCFIELAKLLLGRGEDVLDLLDEGLALQPGNRLLHWLKAKALIASRRYDEAMPILRTLAYLDPASLVEEVSYDQRIFGAPAFADMGLCAFRMERYAESERWFGHAEALAPDSLEFRTKRQLAGMRAGTVHASHPPAQG